MNSIRHGETFTTRVNLNCLSVTKATRIPGKKLKLCRSIFRMSDMCEYLYDPQENGAWPTMNTLEAFVK